MIRVGGVRPLAIRGFISGRIRENQSVVERVACAYFVLPLPTRRRRWLLEEGTLATQFR